MEYKEFVEHIKASIKKIIREEDSVDIVHVVKNNDIEYDGIYILRKDKSMSPTIYLNEYYKDYVKGRELESIVSEVISIYENNKEKLDGLECDFKDFSKIRNKVHFKLVNSEKNKKMLKTIPSREFLDMSVVYYLVLDRQDTINITTMVNNTMLEYWNISDEELYNLAYKNTLENCGYMIQPMNDVIKGIVKNSIDINEEEWEMMMKDMEVTNFDIDMYVLTNSGKNLGACCMMYEGILKDFSINIDRDIYILPSSIHEVILIPKDEEYEIEKLLSMVKDVNSTEVHPMEVLSDHVYEYIRDEDKIIIH